MLTIIITIEHGVVETVLHCDLVAPHHPWWCNVAMAICSCKLELTSLSEANGVERNGVILSVVLLWTSKEQVVRLRQ